MTKFHWLRVRDRLYASAIMLEKLLMLETVFLGAPFKMPVFLAEAL